MLELTMVNDDGKIDMIHQNTIDPMFKRLDAASVYNIVYLSTYNLYAFEISLYRETSMGMHHMSSDKGTVVKEDIW